MSKQDHEDIRAWYTEKDRKFRELWAQAAAARAAGAPWDEVHKLEEAAIEAGDCGD